jgi:hypothetical protein
MTSTTTKPDSSQPAVEMAVDLFDNWFDPIETEVRARARGFIEEMIRGELDTVDHTELRGLLSDEHFSVDGTRLRRGPR